MKRKTCIYCFIYTFIVSILFSTIGAVPGGAEDAFNFPVGEKLTYSVRWMGIPVGWAVLSVEGITELNGRQVYHIKSVVGTNDFFSKIYRVEDTVQTFVDSEGLYPWRFEKHLREGRYKCDEIMEYDQVKHRAVYGRDDKKDVVKEMEIPPRVQDALSCLYYFRAQTLEVGRPISIKVNADEKNWNMKVDVLAKEIKEIRNVGVFNTFKVEPKAEFEGIFVRRGKLLVWLTADSRRIPVMMVTRIPKIGSVVAVLDKIEGASLPDEHKVTTGTNYRKNDKERVPEEDKNTRHQSRRARYRRKM